MWGGQIQPSPSADQGFGRNPAQGLRRARFAAGDVDFPLGFVAWIPWRCTSVSCNGVLPQSYFFFGFLVKGGDHFGQGWGFDGHTHIPWFQRRIQTGYGAGYSHSTGLTKHSVFFPWWWWWFQHHIRIYIFERGWATQPLSVSGTQVPCLRTMAAARVVDLIHEQFENPWFYRGLSHSMIPIVEKSCGIIILPSIKLEQHGHSRVLVCRLDPAKTWQSAHWIQGMGWIMGKHNASHCTLGWFLSCSNSPQVWMWSLEKWIGFTPSSKEQWWD